MGEGDPPQAEWAPLVSPDCGGGSEGRGTLVGLGPVPTEEVSEDSSRRLADPTAADGR